ncbi:hypothetical protein L226DRAFT_506637 [Lentinus tigrinus ALCF2SS1-7]|uniref:Protein kinase domain-containing protein n=1 Tax=Lentinus tigrinus ALCF2SS1-6 TaxID=1328759 RepID=A0A5C2SDF5_9APHY|nr:hypothetical protein L227DRAFT_546112 [Lentinus tigrinus ALCF2SS1-6]RPD75930.1 hypothetical protein L226DRAFT_506637 [Lentinus tigrinus ALCF2SS1-7]
MPSQNVEKRDRDIRLWWERDPNGPILKRDRAPPGLRTPNGFVWGHQLDHIFWIQRIPGANAITVWSRSMIKEGGEGYDEHEWDEPLTSPRVRRPWPVLKKFDSDGDVTATSFINEPDRGCADEHWRGISPPAGWRRDPAAVMSPETLEALGDCEDDPEEKCTGPMLSNVGPERVVNPQGEFYDYVWCEHFKALLNRVCDPLPFLAHAVAVTGHVHIVPDATGIIFYAPPEEGDAASKDKAGESSGSTPVTSSGDNSQDAASASTDGDVSMEDLASPMPADLSEDSVSEDSKPSAATEAAKASLPLPRNPFLVNDLPKLEEFIPEEYLPDILMVHDLHNVTNAKKPGRSDVVPIKYKRFYPAPSKDSREEEGSAKKENIAQLHLSKDNRFGAGNHSFVYRAPLTLPSPLYARSQSGQVTVAAKLSYTRCTAHGLLNNEARVYDSLPKHTQEDWCGYNVVPQCRFPVPVSAVAPKFYGYYLPVDEKGNVKLNEHRNCREENPCTVNWPSPILLMEECGNPVEPSKFTADQRTECFSLILRLHHMDIVQGSFYVRNIMCQPGPLSVPPEKRSYDTPSFRIIDFGRGKSWEWELKEGGDVENRRFEFARRIGDEVARARSELLIGDFGF